MKKTKMITKRYNIYKKDIDYYDHIIKPKLASGEKPNLFASFTYITPNFSVLFAIKELAKLAEEGYNIHLVLWDINSLTHNYSRQLPNKINKRTVFIEKKIQEIKSISKSFGMQQDQLKIYKTSELWKRLISIEQPPLFQELYEILTDLRAEDLGVKEKISHFMQMPADIFVANYFHILYPEEITEPMDVIFVGKNKEHMYRVIRKRMFEKGLISMERPVFLVTKNIPYIIYQNAIPEWNMDLDEIVYIVSNYKPSLDDVKQVFSEVLADMSDEFVLIEDQKEQCSLTELLKKLPKLKKKDLYLTLSHNLYKYFQKIKAEVDLESHSPDIMHISDKEEAVKLGKVLKSRIFLDILLLADGSYNTTDIAKKLEKQVANISVYVNSLKKMGLISVGKKGKIQRTIRGVNLNFEAGLRR